MKEDDFMKLIHYSYNDKEEIGILDNGYIKPLKVSDFDSLISSYSLDDLNALDKSITNKIKRSDVKPLAFINKPNADIICAGMNYKEHKDECVKEGVDTKDRVASVYFSKRASYIITSGDIINRHPDITRECDYEGELGVILYKDLYNGDSNQIKDSIFGYVIMNDVSARDMQRYHKQYYFAKSLDTYTVMSEVLVTKDEFDDYPNLEIKTYVNNELRQHDYTSNMIYSIEDMLEELSFGITLKKGTILSTGTPSGVGMAMEPKKFLNSGDIIRIEIEDIGILENKCE